MQSKLLHSFLLVFLAAFISFSAAAQAQKRYLDALYLEEDLQVDSNVVYVHYDNNSYLRNHLANHPNTEQLAEDLGRLTLQIRDIRMDVYMPPAQDPVQQRPLIIFVHGGGFVVNTKKDLLVTRLCREFACKGYVTASIDYRKLGVYNPTLLKSAYLAIQDGKAAVRYLRSHAGQYGIDPNLIYIGGFSAGAVTALHTGYLDEGEDVAGRNEKYELVYGCVDCAGDNLSVSSAVKGVINISGGVINQDMFNNNPNVSCISFHGTADRIVSFDHDLPFQPVMGKYNGMVKKAGAFFASITGKRQVESTINTAQMEPLFGARFIHERLKNLPIHQEVHAFKGELHNLLMAKNGTPRKHYRFIVDKISHFLQADRRPPVQAPTAAPLPQKVGSWMDTAPLRYVRTHPLPSALVGGSVLALLLALLAKSWPLALRYTTGGIGVALLAGGVGMSFLRPSRHWVKVPVNTKESGLFVRKSPGMQGEKLYKVKKGDIVLIDTTQVRDVCEPSGETITWIRVQQAGKQEGWSAKVYLQ